MRILLAAIVLAAGLRSAPAAAQEATCAVTVVRSPDAARETIEQILATEHCTTSLQVRVIPTTGGLYILATDDHGRVRERVVPDATSAGVLIASWSADDGVVGALPPPPPAPSTWQGAVRATAYGDPFHPPGEASVGNDDGVPPVAVGHPGRFAAIGVVAGANGAEGFRGELDVFEHAGWTLGLAGSLTNGTMQIDNASTVIAYNQSTPAKVADYGIAAALGRIARYGDWHVRGSLGIGVLITEIDLDQVVYTTADSPRGTGTAAGVWGTASVFLGYSLGDAKKWELEVGPSIGYSEQTWEIANTMATLTRQAGSFVLAAQLRRGI